MKFNKEDLGLYFALGLVCGGAGLMVGAFIASKLNRLAEDEEELLIVEPGEIKPTETEEEKRREAFMKDAEDAHQVMVREEGYKSKPKVKQRQLADEFDSIEEYERFIELYSPETIQLEMYRTGLVDFKQFEQMLIDKKVADEAEPYPYGSQYTPDIDEKPDLDEVVASLEKERHEALNDRYLIFIPDPDEEVPESDLELFYDPVDKSVVKLSGRGHPIPIVDIEKYIDANIWEAVQMEFATNRLIFVHDKHADKMYAFEAYGADEEEALSADDGPT